MNVEAIAKLLGKLSTDPAVEAALVGHGVRRRPRLAVDDSYDPDGLVVQSQDFVSNLSKGIEFGFQDENVFNHLDNVDAGEGPIILTEVYFYGKRPGARPYPFALPFGLSLDDSRSIVREKMAALERTRRSYMRDTWELPAFRVTVSYADGDTRIDFLVCMLRAETSELSDAADASLPSAADMTRLLGKSIDDSAVLETFRPLGLVHHKTSSVSNDRVADLRKRRGIKLRFRRRFSAGQAALLLDQIEYVRPNGFESCGWQGSLPFGIRFDDSPDSVTEKVGLAPRRQADQDFVGEVFWELPEWSMRVKYSTMENFVLSVDLFAAEGESE